ncbi:hypothetical protein [Microbacterium capsulatum]|uniref:Cell division protein FtsL n=1 Tax=Microbacterium capsulatum TaxID=3041921 RepID=A0ABU0XFH5_9MICO|nr:hypothetical protein [Microbacterium sp. ASV81]MDQ4212955.1 hypothetical protein [Microbacterium sp. ASV81]
MSLADPNLLQPEFDEQSSRHLRAVERPSRRRRPKLLYALVALAGAALIGGAQIVLTIATTQDSFVVSKLSMQNKELNWEAQAAAQDLDGISSPQALADAASGMGLVVGGSTNYLRLSDGRVIGAAGPAAWASTVDPRGKSGVANALVHDTPSNTAAPAAPGGVQPNPGAAPAPDPNVPPTAEGLPTPTIR